jgi:hypothetical protein
MRYMEKSRKALPPAVDPVFPNAVEVLSNVFYLIEHKADTLKDVRRYLDLAAPALQAIVEVAQKQVTGREYADISQAS